MLYFEPIKDTKAIPRRIAKTIKALAIRGFKGSYADDLELINLGRMHPLIENGGKFIYNGAVVGYLRALPPPERA